MPSAFLYNEEALLIQLKSGDKKAFTTLYEIHGRSVYLNLLRLIKVEALAEEMLQDIFVLIWEKRETIVIRQSFTSYLTAIAQNKITDFFRTLKRDRKLRNSIKAISSSEYTHIEEVILRRELQTIFQKAINALPPQRRQVFCLCKVEGKSYHEVSGLLGISTSTINDHIVKATRKIKDVILQNQESASLWLWFLLLFIH
ncbi:MAG TPA: sigma-70 family RNA polymerase sigma factor [Agriterribacter sp.]|nr:sigma-70 family RNA polymerase sigma factor [Agriterribacter sp.]